MRRLGINPILFFHQSKRKL